MAKNQSRSTYGFSERIRRMKTHLYLLLLAAGISAAPHMSSMSELLTLLQQMWESTTKDNHLALRIETPDNIDLWLLAQKASHIQTEDVNQNYLLTRADDVNCVSTIFEGTEQLRHNPAMKKFSVFFQKFERMKQFLAPNVAKEGKCDTERKTARMFIEKLVTFIRKASKNARA